MSSFDDFLCLLIGAVPTSVVIGVIVGRLLPDRSAARIHLLERKVDNLHRLVVESPHGHGDRWLEAEHTNTSLRWQREQDLRQRPHGRRWPGDQENIRAQVAVEVANACR